MVIINMLWMSILFWTSIWMFTSIRNVYNDILKGVAHSMTSCPLIQNVYGKVAKIFAA